MFRFLKFGKEINFFAELRRQAEIALEAARAFQQMGTDREHAAEHAKAVTEAEHRGDALKHTISEQIDATFITPIDKEDLDQLARALDDITNAVHAVAMRVKLYKLAEDRPELTELAGLLVECVGGVGDALGCLAEERKRPELLPHLQHVHEREKKADAVFRHAIADLFDAPGAEPLMVMKWKEVYEWLEEAIDRCEATADLLERVGVKYA